ncbi:12-oxophytodienoate reductase [Sphingomonas sp. MMS24-J13]|uniref:oxidoreductase n=1 Tax=Sphingomonas sp. MMS24-J13 TaxID=3238686 RepID=UPI00384D0A8B
MASNPSPLFSPFRLKSLELASRFVLPGMQRGWSVGGAPTDRLSDYYVRRVHGGVGLIITELVAVDHVSSTRSEVFSRLDDSSFDAWQKCVAAVREAGGKIIMQLWHEGAIRKDEPDPERPDEQITPTLSPSGLMAPDRPRGRAALAEELEEIKDAFVRSALLAQKAGAHGVEIHGAHGYFLDQFLWANTNRRDDDYGGPTIADRARYPAAIARAIRAACGEDFLISFRFSQWKEIDLRATIVDSPEELGILVSILREARVDVLHISTRRFWEPAWPHSDKTMSHWVKELSGLPVIAVGSVGLTKDIMETVQGQEADHHIAESITLLEQGIARGDFDLIAVGRGQIGDPDWVRKAREGRFHDIIPFTREALGKIEGENDHMEGVPSRQG